MRFDNGMLLNNDMIHGRTAKMITKWDDDDMNQLSRCKWMINYKLEVIKDEKERNEYYLNLLRVILNCLPKPELNMLNKKLKNKALNNNPGFVEANVSFAILDMKNKFRTNKIYKDRFIDTVNPEDAQEISFREFRTQQLTLNYIPGTPEYIEQREKKLPGYEPDIYILKNIEPMEILEYAGIKLTKYDKFHGVYSALIEYPQELNKNPDILFNDDPRILETSAEFMFEEAIDNFLEKKRNPFGSKSFTEVDISNVQEVMDSNNINPLEMDIF